MPGISSCGNGLECARGISDAIPDCVGCLNQFLTGNGYNNVTVVSFVEGGSMTLKPAVPNTQIIVEGGIAYIYSKKDS